MDEAAGDSHDVARCPCELGVAAIQADGCVVCIREPPSKTLVESRNERGVIWCPLPTVTARHKMEIWEERVQSPPGKGMEMSPDVENVAAVPAPEK
jgi:hypothetical protein